MTIEKGRNIMSSRRRNYKIGSIMEDLFGNQIKNNPWQKEWQDMPEFIQEKNVEYQAIIVRFNSEEDVNQFAKLINQKLYPTTQSIWFPKLTHIGTKLVGRDNSRRYVDEP